MKAMVLAAGVGERMRPLTNYLPKPLLPIANRPVMAYILDHLAQHGFTEIVANVHYRAQDIVDYFGDGSSCGVRLTYSYEDKLWGSAGSVKRNQHFFAGERFLVIGADDLTDMDLTVLWENHERLKAIATIGLVEVEDTSQFGIVVTDQEGRIQRFVEKPRGKVPSRTANTQIYLFDPKIHNFIPLDQWYDFGFNVFPQLVAAGQRFYGFTLPGYWRDIGSIEDYLAAQWDALEGRINVVIPGDQVAPGVWVGRGCEIHPQAKLVAPVAIGDGCRIGPDAIVGEATAVASGVTVPAGTLLLNCVAWADADVPPGQQLRKAVLGRGGIIAGLDLGT